MFATFQGFKIDAKANKGTNLKHQFENEPKRKIVIMTGTNQAPGLHQSLSAFSGVHGSISAAYTSPYNIK